jgi:hypothetical protein
VPAEKFLLRSHRGFQNGKRVSVLSIREICSARRAAPILRESSQRAIRFLLRRECAAV